jgi:hypothetical protein
LRCVSTMADGADIPIAMPARKISARRTPMEGLWTSTSAGRAVGSD